MTRFAQTFVLLTAFLSQVSLQDDSLALFPRVGGPPAPARQYVNNSTQISFQVGLAGRSLLNSSLDNRAGGCTDAGYSPCSNVNACCPTGDTCCSFGCCDAGQSCCGVDHCVDPGETCCDIGSCPSGWDCCTLGTCYPIGGQCCTTGDYCTAGNICVLVDGFQGCCTDIHCTAHVSSGVTYSAYVPASNPTNTAGVETGSLITTTSPHAVPTKIAIYEYYYFTITWFYYSWYWTYSPAPAFMSTTFTLSTFTDITTYTTVSVYATDSFAASGKNPAFITQVSFKLQDNPPCLIRSVKVTKPTTDSFLGISETFSGFTPAAATSILAETPFPSSSSPSHRVPSATGSGFSGGRSGAESLKIGLGVGMWASLVVGVGGLMVWL